MGAQTFAGRRFLVTGAGSGIGRRVAQRLWAQGARVALLDRDADAVAGTVAGLAGRRRPEALDPCDVRDEDQVRAGVARAAAVLGGIDGVVNSAGIDCRAPVAGTTTAQWQDVMAVNVTGTFLVCREALPHLRAAPASTVVNVASAAGLRPLPGRAAYSASKAAVVMFTKVLATEGAADGLRANAVCPGAVDTPLFRASVAGLDEQRVADVLRARGYLLDRPGTVDEAAEAVLFLSAAASSYVTGVAFAVDGGRSLW